VRNGASHSARRRRALCEKDDPARGEYIEYGIESSQCKYILSSSYFPAKRLRKMARILIES